SFTDEAVGSIEDQGDGAGFFTIVTLLPKVQVEGHINEEELMACHHEAHEKCFIANSIKTPINIEPLE
ncbi:MAG: OsmC family protein, partial [Flavobacteriales bacterium]|nr:OsmC family protein [Flavobacteriales bacterium]